MAGYSSTPLAKKLGIVAGSVVQTIGAPEEYTAWLAPLPDDVKFAQRVSSSTNVVHLFTTERAELQKILSRLRKKINPASSVWVSWPKQSSNIPTDITENIIREIALPLGFVDIKVCAVSEIWSGLKLVIRKELRYNAPIDPS